MQKDGFDALRTLFDSDDWRGVVNLLGQSDGEGFREKVIPASDFVVLVELPIEGLVAQHEQGRPGLDPIIDAPKLSRATASDDAPRLRQKSDRFIWSYFFSVSGDGQLGSVTSPSSLNMDQMYFCRMPFSPSARSSAVRSYGHSTFCPGVTRILLPRT